MAEMTKPGNPAEAVHLLTPQWVQSYGHVMTGSNVATILMRPQRVLELAFKVVHVDGAVVAGVVPCSLGAPVIVGNEIHRWGLRRLGAGMWLLSPSIVVRETLHAFMILTGAPDPAPWDTSIR